MARNLVECALLAGIARARHAGVAVLLGADVPAGPPPAVASNQCIFAGTSLDEALARATRYAAEGLREIKIRLGVESPESEAARVRAIRAAAGDSSHLAVDANGTRSVEESIARLSLLDGLGLDHVEQPTQPGDWVAFAAVRARTGLAVMADEGLQTIQDVAALMRLGPPFLAHVKLPKAREPRALAVRPDHAELYGASRIAADPASGLAYRSGAACLAEAEGMGVRLDPASLPPPLGSMGNA